jgi:hypothetical protein
MESERRSQSRFFRVQPDLKAMVASADNIELAFKRDVSDELEIVREGPDRYVVITPLAFGDGDVLPIVLRRQDNDGWLLTDEGHTFMQLTLKRK